MSTPSTILEIAKAIVQDATVVDEYIRSEKLPQPSFDVGAPMRLTIDRPEVVKARENLLASTRKLHHLVNGPGMALLSFASGSDDVAVLGVLYRFNIAHLVPLEGQISFEELASATGIPVFDLKRLLRLAMTDWIFAEPEPGFVAHTALSQLLRANKHFVHINVEERFQGAARLADAIQANPSSEEPKDSGWGVAHNAQLPLFEELATHHPQRAAEFAGAMGFMATRVPINPTLQLFDWASLGKAKVVDIGGGKGPVSIALARAFPELSMIVQDFQDTIEDGRRQLPEDVQDRVTFMAHDFFTPQPIKDADVYFFRSVFHNWPRKYCVRILQNLIPALRNGVRILVQDPILREKGTVSAWQERETLLADLRMKIFFNSHNNEVGEWKDLFTQADPRFRFQGVKLPQSTSEHLGIVEGIWDG